MAVIDPDGLFNGDRLSKCSKMARLWWPYLYLASNGCGRLELNYRRLHARIFCTFEQPPTEEDFGSYIEEFFNNYLLFVYRCNGQWWGQWDTPDANLPRYKTAADKRSLGPPAEDFSKWKQEYSEKKKSFATKFQGMQNFSEMFQTAPETMDDKSQDLPLSAHGGGKGEGGGSGLLSGVGGGAEVGKSAVAGERWEIGIHQHPQAPARRKRY